MNTTVKVTMKNTKDDMLKFLETTLTDISDTALTERVQYTLSNYEKAKKAEIFETVEEVQSYLDSASTESLAPATNEEKKTSKKPVVKPTEHAMKPKKTPKKVEEPKTEEHADTVETTKQIGSLPIARLFPETLNIENLGVLKRAEETYKTMEDVAKALEEGKHFYFACYWTQRHLKEYNYSSMYRVQGVKKFPNDLDILEPVYFCENVKRMWANSVYTEAMCFFENDEMEHINDTDPYNGEKFRVRVSNGMEFELYELVED